MNSAKSLDQFVATAGIFLYAILLGIVITLNPRTGYVFALLPMFAWVILQRQNAILVLLLMLLPFHASPSLAQNIMGIPGMKPFNLLAGMTLLLLLMRGGNLLHFKDPLEKKSFIVLFVYFIIFSLTFIRSLQNLSLFHELLPDSIQSSAVSYILSYYVKDSLYLVSFIVILKTVRTETEIKTILSIVAGSMFLLSCAIIIIGGLHLGDISQQGRDAIRQLCLEYFGMHYNSVGSIYRVCAPILLFKALGKNRFWLVNFSLAIVAILFLQSRTTLLTFCGSILLLLILLKRIKFLIFFAAGTLVIILFWLPESIMQGFAEGIDVGTPDAVLSGRVNHLWIPVLQEWLENPRKLLLGAGSYGILTSPLWLKGFILQVPHAHNAFIDFFLDSGIILLSFLIYFIFSYMIAAWRMCKKIDTPLCWALFATLVAYLIGTFTEGQFYPNQENMFLYPSMALLINLIRLYLYKDYSPQTKST